MKKLALLVSILISLVALASGQINPADYGTITLRLKAEDLTYSNGAGVTNWGFFTAGGTAIPTFVASDARFNNKPVVRFDGVDDVIKYPSANIPAQTIFAVVTLESGAGTLAGLLGRGDDKLDIRRHNTTNFYRSPAQGQDTNDLSGVVTGGNLFVNNVASGAYAAGTPHIVMAVAGSPQAYTNFWVGSPSASLGRFWNGSVAEIIVYSGTLTADGINKVGYYLQSKYNITNGGYPSPTATGTFTAAASGITASTGVLSTAGAPVTLAWNIANATSVSINNGVLAAPGTASGTATVSPATTTTYTLTASNLTGSITKTVTVYVGLAMQPLVLNEFLADNGSSVLDEDGTKQDWIELYNPNHFAVSANGWQLLCGTDLWTFPALTVEGNAYPVIFASGKDRANPAAPLHTNFKLGKDGEYLALKKPDGTVVTEFSPTFPVQRTDISYGQSSGAFAYFPTSTPGAANGAATVAGFVADTNFSAHRGFFATPQMVAISCTTPGATIKYTLDNSTPTDTNGTVYSAPLTISATTVLRARAFGSGLLPSNTDTETYVFIGDVPNQIFASGTAPPGWPVPGAAQLNGQTMRYGIQTALKAQYSAQQIADALTQVPSLSIVTDQPNLTDQITGIYSNADQKGDAWERAASVEYLPQDNSTGFHINCGLRIRGGASRGDYAPKHSFRLYFRNSYGAGTLSFPLHGLSGTSDFQTIDIRSEENYSWANDTGTQNTQVREVFCRDLQGAMGQPLTRSRYLHVYLNGQYWGLYMTEERAQEDYAATYYGGTSDDYDVVQTSNHPNFTYELANGTITAWQNTWNLARACAANPTNANYFALLGRDANGVRVPSKPVYIDPDHLASYMILLYYTGDGDGPLSNFLGYNEANNWRGFRNRNNDQGWRFFAHDCEHTLLATSWVNGRAIANTTGGSNRTNFTYSNSEWLHEDLATNVEYRLKIADMAQKYLLNNGALTPAKAQVLFDARAAQINQAVVADCIRWGTSTTNHTLAQWQARLADIRANFFPSRTATVIGHLQTRGFLPSATAPIFSQHGGQVATNYALTLSANGQAGTIFYRLDGADPRAVGGAVASGTSTYTSAIAIAQNNTLVRTRFLSSGGVWSALDEGLFTYYSPAIAGKLVVSKIHYHPTDATSAESNAGYSSTDFEYLELLNISSTTLDLTGIVLSGALDYTFTAASAITSLAPGARVLVVGNAAAFTMRYGSGQPVAGAFSGNLSNSGETLRVADATNATIVQCTYNNKSPWPEAADGLGPCLVLIHPTSNPDPNIATNWRVSVAAGGAPGVSDALGYAEWANANSVSDLAGTADDDQDGLVTLQEYFLGTNANQFTNQAITSGVQTMVINAVADDYLTITFTRAIGRDDAALTVEASSDLTQPWTPAVEVGTPVYNGSGTETLTFRHPQPRSAGVRQFLRVKLTRVP